VAKRKDYTLQASNVSELLIPASIPWEIVLPGNTINFKRWLYLNRPQLQTIDQNQPLVRVERDDIVIAIRNAIWRLQPVFAHKTVTLLCASGVSNWFAFLDWKYDNDSAILTMEDITSNVIEQYIEWLRFKSADTTSTHLSYSGAKSVYTQTKSVLSECANVGALPRSVFPKNPFPNSNRARISYKPYSKGEMIRLLKALSTDLLEIRRGDFKGMESDRLAVYFFLISARTGRNPISLLEAERNALQPHPLNPKTKALLVLYKRRGNNISLQSFRKTIDIEGVATIQTDVATLFNEVIEITKNYVNVVPVKLQNRLWLCKIAATNQYRGNIVPLDVGLMHHAAKRFVSRHNLSLDAIDPKTGQSLPFQLTAMRLRKTFATRMWQLSGGDLVKTAQALGNTPRVADMHYLEVTPQMERQHKFVGHCLETKLRGKENDSETILNIANEMKVSEIEVERILNGKNNTGVGRCTSPFYGEFAPKDGKNACTTFLFCFRCPNQVVMEDDLYRLFSFYWLIIKERNLMDRTKWKKIYGWVIREVHNAISSKFNPKIVKEARDAAKANPHPMWRDRALLGGAYA